MGGKIDGHFKSTPLKIWQPTSKNQNKHHDRENDLSPSSKSYSDSMNFFKFVEDDGICCAPVYETMNIMRTHTCMHLHIFLNT